MRTFVIAKEHFSAVLAAFLLSRVLLFTLIVLGSQIAFIAKVYSNSVWETRIFFEWVRVRPELTRTVMVGDSNWYRLIAVDGYDRDTPADRSENWPFFPFYPLVLRMLRITGDIAIDGMIVSNIALLGALFLLRPVGLYAGFTTEDVDRAIFYLAFFPTSYFLSFPLTESLFLLLSLGCFLCAQKGRWWSAGVLGFLGALTRFTGILLFPALLVLALQRKPNPRFNIAWLGLVPAGTLVYMSYLNRISGDALGFVHSQSHYGRSFRWFWQPLWDYLANARLISHSWNFSAFQFAVAMLLLIAGTILCVQRKWPFGIYTLTSVLVPLSSGSLQSMGRYALVAFPMFLWLGAAGRSSVVDRTIIAISITLFGWFLALFTLHIDFALA